VIGDGGLERGGRWEKRGRTSIDNEHGENGSEEDTGEVVVIRYDLLAEGREEPRLGRIDVEALDNEDRNVGD
jgi:hypothetical protein